MQSLEPSGEVMIQVKKKKKEKKKEDVFGKLGQGLQT